MMKSAGVNNIRSAIAWLLAAMVVLTTPVLSQNTVGASPKPPHRKRHVIVSIPDRKLALLENDAVLVVFPIAVGADLSPSPTGQFQIVTRLANPTYYHPGIIIPPGNDNPIGTRWVGFDKKGYGIHGTNAPHSIGEAASHGCIRMHNRDIEQLFRMVKLGDTVDIRGERDEQMAMIFGGEVEATATSVAQTEVPQNQMAQSGNDIADSSGR